MASSVLYPPIVNDYASAFIAAEDSICRIFFSLSKFNASTDFTSAHCSILKQGSGANMVNRRENEENRFRNAGLIINIPVEKVEDTDNLYYIDLINADVLNGWEPGCIYKIQIRLSMMDYDNTIGQSAWLNTFADQFSEWSTVCIIKAIGAIDFTIPNYQLEKVSGEVEEIVVEELSFTGTFNSADVTEKLYAYRIGLLDENYTMVEDSGILYPNKYFDSNQFSYTFKTEAENNKRYIIRIAYETINKYTSELIIHTLLQYNELDEINISLLTAENDAEGVLKGITTISQEEEEGRVYLQVSAAADESYTGQLMIRRAGSRDNFKVWSDIKLIDFPSDTAFVYDYTIESGIWYKYGIQKYEKSAEGNISRGPLNIITNPLMRDFNYTFLLGENNQQLKLQFNNTLDGLKATVNESIVNTLGGEYPLVARLGAAKYKTFNLGGLISFNMDENHLFLSEMDIYKFEEVAQLYKNYNTQNGISTYDYTYEREFRDKVMEFLYNGQVKLLKSPTEGNILVYLSAISLSSNAQLSRLIYTFSSTATEVAKFNRDNLIKYKLTEI